MYNVCVAIHTIHVRKGNLINFFSGEYHLDLHLGLAVLIYIYTLQYEKNHFKNVHYLAQKINILQ